MIRTRLLAEDCEGQRDDDAEETGKGNPHLLQTIELLLKPDRLNTEQRLKGTYYTTR